MTRAQKADALLGALKYWQNGEPREGSIPSTDELCRDTWDWGANYQDNLTACASAALSDVCALGYDIDGAEKVATFEPVGGVVRDDGTTFAIYKGRAVR